jgi:hypothetical protein
LGHWGDQAARLPLLPTPAARGRLLPAERVAQQARGLPAAEGVERVLQLGLVLCVERAELRVGEGAHELGAGGFGREALEQLAEQVEQRVAGLLGSQVLALGQVVSYRVGRVDELVVGKRDAFVGGHGLDRDINCDVAKGGSLAATVHHPAGVTRPSRAGVRLAARALSLASMRPSTRPLL